MYSIDVHPDGTRFATAGGDGSVKIWSTASLFGGKLVFPGEGDVRQHHGGGDTAKEKTRKMKKRKMPSSKFAGNGNYISSNTEDYDDSTSSSSSSSSSEENNDDANLDKTNPATSSSFSTVGMMAKENTGITSTARATATMAGVNDLSGLVRSKKGGGGMTTKVAPAGMGSKQQMQTRPLSLSSSSSSPPSLVTNPTSNTIGDHGALSPMSKLARRGTSFAPSASVGTDGIDVGGGSFDDSGVGVGVGGDASTYPNSSSSGGGQKMHPNQQPNQQQHQQQQQRNNNNNKLLCTISSHEGSVLSLRFSPSGTYLATAGDDSYVNIYTRCAFPSLARGNLVGLGYDGASSSSGRGGGAGGRKCEDIEHWNRIAICRGHHLDVVGLAWAPDDSHLVSCSLDSVHPIIVWRLFDVLSLGDIGGGGCGNNGGGVGGSWDDPTRAGGGSGRMGVGDSTTVSATTRHMVHNLHPHKILGRNIHTSTVKGVAFDPAGKYLASSGDDPAICIWRAFDDWGLEARIDSSSGVFRSNKRKRQPNDNHGNTGADFEEDDPCELASLSLFRRISFAPDGSHVCGTNATLRGKNIAAMISREGWMASGPRDGKGGEGADSRPPSGAANLVGHKQPVVASRHCPVFFAVPKRSNLEGSSSDSSDADMDDPDEEPEYATLVALGDKSGFVTIWSTRSSRPLFKMQCSESRCTVTDISWGTFSKNNAEERDGLVMIVSLLDGYIVALNFDIPAEVGGGSILSSEKTRRIFRVKYGIEDFVGSYCFTPGKQHVLKKRLVDDSGPILIENAFQLMMEMEADAEKNDCGVSSEDVNFDKEEEVGSKWQTASDKIDENDEHTNHKTACTDGAISNVSDDDNVKANRTAGDGKKLHEKSKEKQVNSLQGALHAASQAAVAAEGVATLAANRVAVGGCADSRHPPLATAQVNPRPPSEPAAAINHFTTSLEPAMRVPFSVSKTLSVDLTAKLTAPLSSTLSNGGSKIIADCTNVTFDGNSSSSPWPYTTLNISSGGEKKWKDIIVRSNATALSANHQLLVVGTSDGCLYFYGTSPTIGWMSCRAYRAFPPFVLGSPVVQINIRGSSNQLTTTSCDMVVVTSDGNFFVYSFRDSVKPTLAYKGSIVPAMKHMQISSISTSQIRSLSPQPKLSRIQIADSNQLMLILCLPLKAPGGRSLKGFVYNLDMELWMCISDSNNFVFSDFYHSIPGEILSAQSDSSNRGENANVGMLARMDRIVRSNDSVIVSAKQVYQKITSSDAGYATDRYVTRSHCEDRLACTIALGSSSEFKTWLRYYARCLVSTGSEDALRFLVDILLNDQQVKSPSFLSLGKQTLNLVGKDLVRGAILPECQTSRLLQRFTNELSMELDSLE